MPATSIIVLVVDRLGAGWLGPYGNSWVDTPAFNRLASASLLLDNVLAGSPELQPIYDGYWYGSHPFQGTVPSTNPTLMEYARKRDIASTLVTDSDRVASFYAAGDFDETVSVPKASTEQLAADVSSMQLAQTVAMAIDSIHQQANAHLLWIHAAAFDALWDAPSALVHSLLDEDDPQPPAMAKPPELTLADAFDPDQLMGITQTYAAQVIACDMLLDALLEVIASQHDTLFVMTSTRGYPLGEHQRVGPCHHALFGELLHVPMMVRFPDRCGAAARCQRFVQPHDLFSTLLAAMDVQAEDALPIGQDLRLATTDGGVRLPDRVCAVTAGEYAIRTPAWFMRDVHEERICLYAKPDDYWEANEVSTRCTEVVRLLQQEKQTLEAALHAGELASLPPLPDVLVHGLD